ncbi:hypothetical protein TrRE_jg6034 [Triparma retinervis]|uniref:Uncharacterized protein n=1 Tax=Triparma retinervis TaxID=2557542 RepID=A0A9W7CGU8_9STRA|nr:hypothetical protein TrRE_jg6034 [Triparma retinervis]
MSSADGYYYSDLSCKEKANDAYAPTSDVLKGYCENPAVPAHRYMECFRVNVEPLSSNSSEWGMTELIYPDANGTDYRCGCHRLYALEGPGCDVSVAGWGGWYSHVFMTIQLMVTFFLFWRASRCSIFLVKAAMATNKKMGSSPLLARLPYLDSVAVCSITMTMAMFFTCIMNGPVFFGRALMWIDNHEFEALLWSFPITVMCVAQSMNVLAIAWLTVAIKSDKVSGGHNVAKYERGKKFLKGCVVLVLVMCIFFWFASLVGMITLLANFVSLVMSIALRIGGSKIAKLLLSGAAPDQKSINLAAAMKRAYTILIFAQPLLILSAMAYNAAYGGVLVTGERNMWGVLVSSQGMMACMLTNCYGIIDFVYRVKIVPAKKETAKVAPGATSKRRKSTVVSTSSVSTESQLSTTVSRSPSDSREDNENEANDAPEIFRLRSALDEKERELQIAREMLVAREETMAANEAVSLRAIEERDATIAGLRLQLAEA